MENAVQKISFSIFVRSLKMNGLLHICNQSLHKLLLCQPKKCLLQKIHMGIKKRRSWFKIVIGKKKQCENRVFTILHLNSSFFADNFFSEHYLNPSWQT